MVARPAVPVTPPAPGLCISTIGWPRSLEAASASVRKIGSNEPPGGNGITSWIGLFGYGSAAHASGAAAPAAANAASAASAPRREGFIMVSSPFRVEKDSGKRQVAERAVRHRDHAALGIGDGGAAKRHALVVVHDFAVGRERAAARRDEAGIQVERDGGALEVQG